MSGTDIRVADLPDLGAVTDASSIVADVASGTGRFSALAVKAYCAVATLPDAPFTNTPYGRQNGTWTAVVSDAPSNNVSYGRRNATWAVVVPEAPLTGATFGRVNGAWTEVLPTTGGAINGNISTTGNVLVGGATYCQTILLSSTNSYEWKFYIQAGTGNHLQEHSGGYYDMWEHAGGARVWVAGGAAIMNLSAAGVLSTLNYVQAPEFWSGATAGQFGFAASPGGRIFQFSPGFYWAYTTANATLEWTVSNGPLWVMRASDDFCFNAQGPVGGVGAYINSSDRRGKTGIIPTTKGLAEILQLQPVEFDRLDPTTGSHAEIGFVAQDVQPVVPEAVWTAGIPLQDGSGGLESGDPTLGLSSETITAILVNAIKELNTRIAVLEGGTP
jgi:hypothetical protein